MVLFGPIDHRAVVGQADHAGQAEGTAQDITGTLVLRTATSENLNFLFEKPQLDKLGRSWIFGLRVSAAPRLER